MEEIQLFIITYNRPTLLIKSLQSALKQDFKSFRVIVSDNSTNDDTKMALADIGANTKFTYLKRVPTLPVFDHLNTILKEVTAKYFMIFHDDDVMHPQMLSKLHQLIETDQTILAVGANAKLIKANSILNKSILNANGQNISIQGAEQMANCYLVNRGIVPFPSYLYRREVAQNIQFNPLNGGKHCDAAFLMDIAEKGKILFYSQPLMDYYIHGGQDSKSNNFTERSKLINYILKKTSHQRKDYAIKRFRIVNLYLELLFEKTNLTPKRKRKILMLIAKFSPFNYFPKYIIQKLLPFK